jgi:hypothetical protein
MKKTNNLWGNVGFIAICLLILIGGMIPAANSIRAKHIVKQLKPGDTIEIEMKSQDPFQKSFIVYGVVSAIDKRGKYVQYINKHGDTTSTDLRTDIMLKAHYNVTINGDKK